MTETKLPSGVILDIVIPKEGKSGKRHPFEISRNPKKDPNAPFVGVSQPLPNKRVK